MYDTAASSGATWGRRKGWGHSFLFPSGGGERLATEWPKPPKPSWQRQDTAPTSTCATIPAPHCPTASVRRIVAVRILSRHLTLARPNLPPGLADSARAPVLVKEQLEAALCGIQTWSSEPQAKAHVTGMICPSEHIGLPDPYGCHILPRHLYWKLWSVPGTVESQYASRKMG